mgnify:CR=1 FL=1
MYQQIKQLADEALALQNKDRMDATLRQISALCSPGAVMLIDGEYRTKVPPLSEETIVVYQTSSHPGGDPPEIKAALKKAMEPAKKGGKK